MAITLPEELSNLPGAVAPSAVAGPSAPESTTMAQAPGGMAALAGPVVAPPFTPASAETPEIQPRWQPGTFGDRLSKALTATAAHPAAPVVQAQPGGWAKLMVGAVTDALSDAGAASTGPGGWLAGAEAVAGARSQRIATREEAAQKIALAKQQMGIEQQKADAQVAYNQVLTLKLQRDVYQQDRKERQDNYTQGKSTVDALRENHEVKDGVTQDDLSKMVKDNPEYLKTHYAYAVGQESVLDSEGKPQLDANGQPIESPVYAVVNRQPKDGEKSAIPVTQGMADYYKRAGITVPVGTNLSIDDLTSYQKRAQIIVGSLDTIDKANDEKMSADKARQIRSDAEAASSYIAMYPNNPLKGLDEQQKTDARHIDILQKQIAALGQKPGNEDQIAKMTKERDAVAAEAKSIANVITNGFTTETKQQFTKDAETERHDRAEEQISRLKELQTQMGDVGATMTDEMKARISALPADKQAVLKQASASVQPSLLAAAFGPGDLDFDRLFPVRPTKGSNLMPAQTAMSIIQQLNPNWNMQQYKRMGAAYKAITEGPLGNQIGQYNNVLQHGAEAQDIMESTWRKENPSFLNKPINWLEKHGYGTQATTIQAGLMPVKQEFSLLMSAGYKPTESEETAYNTIFNDASTPAQIEAALKVVGAVGAIRLQNINQQFKRNYDQDIPGILTKDSMEAAKRLNLDDATQRRLGTLNVGDTIFHKADWKPATADKVQEQQQAQQAQQGAQAAAKQAVVPAGATHTVPGPDGKMHWTNEKGTVDYGVAQ